MRRKVIVHLTAEFKQTIWGGIATAVEIASTAMAQNGFKVFVISCGPTKSCLDVESLLTWIQIDWLRPALDSLYLAEDRIALGAEISLKMMSILKCLAADADLLVFVHNEEFTGIMSPDARLPNATFAAVSHGLTNQEHPENSALHQQEGRFLSSADAVVVHSREQARLLSHYYPAIRANVVHLPLALLSRDAIVTRDLSLVKPRTLVAAGRDVRQKGFDLIGSALSLLKSEDPIECSVFSGRGDNAFEAIQAIVGTPHTLRLRSWIERSKLLEEVVLAQAVVVPSRFEPLGLFAAEAMSLGVPVIASKVGGLGDLVGDNRDVGLLAPMSANGPSHEGLATAIVLELDRGPRVSSGRGRLAEFSYARFLAEVNLLPGSFFAS